VLLGFWTPSIGWNFELSATFQKLNPFSSSGKKKNNNNMEMYLLILVR